MKSVARRFVFVLMGSALVLWALPLDSQQRTNSPPKPEGSAQRASGQRVFASNCSSCHGLDGLGGARAPDIVTTPQMQKLSAEDIHRIVSAGIPATGMPGFRSLGEPAINAVVAYLANLRGKSRPARLPGDPRRGEEIFFGSGQCSTCHMTAGRGGFIGPDLTAYGQAHTPDKIKAAIANPKERDSARSVVDVVTQSGERYHGVVRNEDNFSLQLQSIDGIFHLLSKSGVTSIERSQESLMPSDYSSGLSASQLNDLVSYLLSIGQSSVPAAKHANDEE